MVDITQDTEAVKAINAIINRQGTAEIKLFRGKTPVVVEVKRTIRTEKPKDSK